MKIAILGWGSLLWDPRELKLKAPFELTGPSLPIEFCRVSKNLRLTLIIDEAFGTLCQTYAATSAFTNLPEAMENLRLREGMTSTANVGFAVIANQERSQIATKLHPRATETIADWTVNAGYDATIWTALDSRFEGQTAEPFSVNAAIRFLENLEQYDPEAFARALEYIRRAPDATQTPVRDRTAAQWPSYPDGLKPVRGSVEPGSRAE
ncbi:hypothetical protein GCM10010909_10840 [Acidocella aquatica]|uniref:Uncharacterized protein n=1 Tax=Acidocella aquatica TaxID=1922313 RepID=A0ABQ6A8E4_9PROT|nr:hypothetical protein [Acidocella aquatica]GLR66404.1 hypothetical protein GCM10010909_10840 [Acidocella aquatica]